MSADPLAVHSPGEADLNVYAYVSGRAVQRVDPLGLQEYDLIRTKRALDDYRAQWNVRIGNRSVAAYFRSAGEGTPAPRAFAAALRAISATGQKVTPELRSALLATTMGRGTASQLKLVTKALIGAAPYGTHEYRMTQLRSGVGLDCKGYVRQGLEYSTGKKFGGAIGDDFAPGGKDAGLFTRVGLTAVRSGDVISLRGSNPTHTHHVLVYEHASLTGIHSVPAELRTQGFAGKGDIIHKYMVDSSWGSGAPPDVASGVGRATWYYNENTGTWAGQNGDSKWVTSKNSAYRAAPDTLDYRVEGAYRPK